MIRSLQSTVTRGITDARACLEKYMAKEQSVNKYITAYRTYCWPVTSINDYKLAPFHILATENHVHADKNHEWHMQEIAGFCTADPQLLLPTPYQVIDLNDPASFDEAVAWWTGLTRNGGEGMVVKPYDFISLGKEGLLQPAVKCRGREYLRIIYGPEYDLPVNLKRLKNRSLGRKQSLALREFALGIEALERFVRKEPLRRIHESVFGVLALESEEVAPQVVATGIGDKCCQEAETADWKPINRRSKFSADYRRTTSVPAASNLTTDEAGVTRRSSLRQ